MHTIPTKNLFIQHSEAVISLYGKPVDISHRKISNKLLERLSEFRNKFVPRNIYGCIPSTGKQSDYYGCISSAGERSNMLISIPRNDVLESLNNMLLVHPLHDLSPTDPLIEDLHCELRQLFKNDINSPFVFVNTRMWTTKPNSERNGPNRTHVDGMESGHLKIMIYLTPMNDEYGYLDTEYGVFTDLPAATAVLFKNSDIKHSGVPGTVYDRVCIEVTLMRALVNGPQIMKGSFFGTHLFSPLVPYEKSVIKALPED